MKRCWTVSIHNEFKQLVHFKRYKSMAVAYLEGIRALFATGTFHEGGTEFRADIHADGKLRCTVTMKRENAP